ncbi:hypothetical protein DL96DRAFT_1104340 [Flagelloscypha sp. PMI_526]|nr:hypothetical protein DL96DRAFT_1104340 [Flagelloscypha sp. PMI_526]
MRAIWRFVLWTVLSSPFVYPPFDGLDERSGSVSDVPVSARELLDISAIGCLQGCLQYSRRRRLRFSTTWDGGVGLWGV